MSQVFPSKEVHLREEFAIDEQKDSPVAGFYSARVAKLIRKNGTQLPKVFYRSFTLEVENGSGLVDAWILRKLRRF